MAITFHMRALHVAATSLNQKSDTFIPTEQHNDYPTECGTFVCYFCSSYCCKLMATKFLGLKVLRLPNVEISDFFRVPGKVKIIFKKWTEPNSAIVFQARTTKGQNRTQPNWPKRSLYNPSHCWAHFRFFRFHWDFFFFSFWKINWQGLHQLSLSLSKHVALWMTMKADVTK